MKLLTFTRLWTAKKRMYSIQDFRLPSPIDLMSAAIFLMVAAVWVPLLAVFNVPFTNGIGLAFYISIPVLAAMYGNKPKFDGKNIFSYLYSQIRYWFQPKVWNSFTPEKEEKDNTVSLSGDLWVKKPISLKKDLR